MGYESNTGLGVNNHYGQRKTGGTQGSVRTSGETKEFVMDFDETGLAWPFPVVDGSAYVTLVDFKVATGTTFTIGGVNVVAATSAVPILIPAANTGVIVSNTSAGRVTVSYKQVPLKTVVA
jgi:hypothetical protein